MNNSSILKTITLPLLLVASFVLSKSEAAVMSNGLYQSYLSNFCLTTGNAVGSSFTVNFCDGSQGQRFTHASNGVMKIFGLCVDSPSGQRVTLAKCSTKSKTQVWYGYPDRTLRNNGNGKCLDVKNKSQYSNAEVVLWDCNGGTNQQWLSGERLGYGYAFLRRSTPNLGIAKPGHVGWGIASDDGRFLAGTVDGNSWPWTFSWDEYNSSAGNNWMQTVYSEAELVKLFSTYGKQSPQGAYYLAYDEYRKFPVLNPNFDNAFGKALTYRNSGYSVALKNCMNQTYDILNSFGSINLPWPDTNWFPTNWYASIKGAKQGKPE